MKEAKKERRDGSFIIRVSISEKEAIKEKVKEAGYKSVSAFVRDYIARSKPKKKTSINGNIFSVQRELMNLSSMINSGSSQKDLQKQIQKISQANMGGKS